MHPSPRAAERVGARLVVAVGHEHGVYPGASTCEVRTGVQSVTAVVAAAHEQDHARSGHPPRDVAQHRPGRHCEGCRGALHQGPVGQLGHRGRLEPAHGLDPERSGGRTQAHDFSATT